MGLGGPSGLWSMYILVLRTVRSLGKCLRESLVCSPELRAMHWVWGLGPGDWGDAQFLRMEDGALGQ